MEYVLPKNRGFGRDWFLHSVDLFSYKIYIRVEDMAAKCTRVKCDHTPPYFPPADK